MLKIVIPIPVHVVPLVIEYAKVFPEDDKSPLELFPTKLKILVPIPVQVYPFFEYARVFELPVPETIK